MFAIEGVQLDGLTTAEIFALTPTLNEMRFNTDLGRHVMFDGTSWHIISELERLHNLHFFETFEGGNFTDKGWVTVNGGENNWIVGTDEKASGTYGAYISKTGGNANYGSQGAGLDVSHVYKDILMPAGPLSQLIIEFDWKCEGEVNFDGANVFNKPTSFTPVANTEVVGDEVGLGQYNDQSIFIPEQIELDTALAGTTRRIIISWRNDTSIENNPPMCFDNFKILYN